MEDLKFKIKLLTGNNVPLNSKNFHFVRFRPAEAYFCPLLRGGVPLSLPLLLRSL